VKDVRSAETGCGRRQMNESGRPKAAALLVIEGDKLQSVAHQRLFRALGSCVVRLLQFAVDLASARCITNGTYSPMRGPQPEADDGSSACRTNPTESKRGLDWLGPKPTSRAAWVANGDGHSNLRWIADKGGLNKFCCVITKSPRPRAAAAIVSRRRRNHGPTRTRATFLSYSASSAKVTSLPSAE